MRSSRPIFKTHWSFLVPCFVFWFCSIRPFGAFEDQLCIWHMTYYHYDIAFLDSRYEGGTLWPIVSMFFWSKRRGFPLFHAGFLRRFRLPPSSDRAASPGVLKYSKAKERVMWGRSYYLEVRSAGDIASRHLSGDGDYLKIAPTTW